MFAAEAARNPKLFSKKLFRTKSSHREPLLKIPFALPSVDYTLRKYGKSYRERFASLTLFSTLVWLFEIPGKGKEVSDELQDRGDLSGFLTGDFRRPYADRFLRNPR